MFYKGIIFDLDNTLYDYTSCHLHGLDSALDYIATSANINKLVLNQCYINIASRLKNDLGPTASSHNKSIYFKQLIETLHIDMSLFINAHQLYWNAFYNNLTCFDGVKEFIEWNKSNNIKIGILTDYETEYQIIKLNKLGLLSYIDAIVTSEEIGIDKPSSSMFRAVLNKMCLTSAEVIMIGDNYEKDIKYSGCYSLWFDENNKFNSYLSEFQSYYDDIYKLVFLSKRCGERFDLVQAGGGNISVKSNTRNFMFIKSSGCHLSSVSLTDGYSVIDNPTGNKLFGKQSSIETSMHSVLKKYTIHLHPIAVNRILVHKNATQIINTIYPDSLILEYLTPGVKISTKLNECYNGQNVIFLLNHGIIITSDNYDELMIFIEDIIQKFEEYQSIDNSRYKQTNTISQSLNPLYTTYLCEDVVINRYFNQLTKTKNFVSFPDALIYCGKSPYIFGEYYTDMPTIIIFDNQVYIHNKNIYKCRDTEDVLKSIVYINGDNPGATYLSDDEQFYLLNWDAEKYRQNA